MNTTNHKFSDNSNSQTLKRRLTDFFSSGIKKERKKMLGLEIEHFILQKETGKAVSYSQKNGICDILQKHMSLYPSAIPVTENNYLLGFKTDDFSISLEPAGQYEISIVAKEKIDDIYKIYKNFRNKLCPILDELGYFLCSAGCQPVSEISDLKFIPKERYRIMSEYFQKKGTRGIEMMLKTAATQVSIDYFSEQDFRKKIQASYLLTPLFQLISETVSEFDTYKNNNHLRRADIWRNTDTDRCGFVPKVFCEKYGFETYANYLCSTPLILKQKGHITVPTDDKTIEQIYTDCLADEQDLFHIMSMVFPDVRLKKYLEIRVADSMPQKQISAYLALIKGLLYCDEILEFCQAFIKKYRISEKDVLNTQKSLMKNGWNGKIYGFSAVRVAKKIILAAQKNLDEQERKYLVPFKNTVSLSQQIVNQYIFLINDNTEKNMHGALALKENMERSALYFRNRCTAKTLAIPKIYTPQTISKFKETVQTAYGIFTKVIRQYLICRDYRKLFPFSKELEELILIPNGYESLLPMARFDIFFHEDTGDFYFCEVNTDGTSAMNEDRLLGKMLIDNPAHQQIIRRYDFYQFELFDSWVQTFLKLYKTYEKRKEKPNVAIVDFLDKGTLREFQEFALHFQKAGINCEICDIREFKFEEGKLISPRGNEIDAIYRRAVTSDILSNIEDVRPFITAVRKQAVFLAGSFCTQIIHNKWLFYILRHKETKTFLTEEENIFIEKHFPETLPFSKRFIDLSTVLLNKNDYILKPLDSYASNGVYAGVEFNNKTWQEKAKSVYEKNYICQSYCPQYTTKNIDFAWGDGKWHSYINMTGLYVYNGNFSGIYSRLAQGNGIIASHRNERTVPTFVVKNKKHNSL